MASNGVPNGSGSSNSSLKVQSGGEVDFLDLLEKEEADFAEQVRRQKTFLQKTFREKEELAQMCVSQAAKLTKLEGERMEWQRKIIETERERRTFQERMDQEQQAHRQSVKKFEKLKRDSDKVLADSAVAVKERNDAVGQLSKELKEIERLEADRRDLFAR